MNVPYGIHAFHAAQVVSACKHLEGKITLICGGRKANGKSILEILLLDVPSGSEIEVVIEGGEEEFVLRKIVDILGTEISVQTIGTA